MCMYLLWWSGVSSLIYAKPPLILWLGTLMYILIKLCNLIKNTGKLQMRMIGFPVALFLISTLLSSLHVADISLTYMKRAVLKLSPGKLC